MATASPQIVVVGGGLVGLAFANLLAARAPQLAGCITVVEKAAPEAPGPELGLRVSAWSAASRALLTECGVWPRLAEEYLSPYRRMVVWRGTDPAGPESLAFDAAEAGLPALGHIVENDRLRTLLWSQAERRGVQLAVGAAPDALQESADALKLQLDRGQSLDCQLLVGADGQASWVRQAAGIERRCWSYGQRGLVAHLAPARAHGQTAWQRFLPGGPLALLPLADGRVSLVWSCPTGLADELEAADGRRLQAMLAESSGGVLGTLQPTTPLRSFPLQAAHADPYIRGRVALIGDAAHQVHPLAGLGANLGLRDADRLAAALAEWLGKRGADAGDRRVLRRYERSRKADNLATLATTDLLHRAFSGGQPGLAALAGRGLGLVDRLSPLKRVFVAAAAGNPGA